MYSSSRAFAALKDDGSVVTWGDSALGGDSSSVSSSISSGVTEIFSTKHAFAALKVIVTGLYRYGADRFVSSQLSSGNRRYHRRHVVCSPEI